MPQQLPSDPTSFPQYGQGYGPQYGPQPAAQPAAQYGPRRRTGPLLFAGVCGFALAGVIALVLGFAGALPATTNASATTSSAAVQLPGKVGNLLPIEQAVQKSGGRVTALIKGYAASDRATARALSAANDGAGAATQAYSIPNESAFAIVEAVRAHTAAPVVFAEDAKDEGLAEPGRQVIKVGAVSCSVMNEVVAAGQPEPAKDVTVSYCQRSEGALTVTVQPGGVGALVRSPQQVAALVNQVWSDVNR